MSANSFENKGLSNDEVISSRIKHGSNTVVYEKENLFFKAIKHFISDPMVVLLLVASTIYFVSGEFSDGLFLASAIILITLLSSYQNSRSRNAIEKLKEFSKPHAKVIRNGASLQVKTEDLVVGDCLVIEEGNSVAADATIIQANDFSVNESILTGESFSVTKGKSDMIFHGTIATTGMALAQVTAIGSETKLNKIGKSLENIVEEKTPLEVQIGHFVKKMVVIGALIFLIVWALNYYNSQLFLDSLLKSLTLAMSILPEEIPIAFTTFMALGAWRMMQKGIIVKQMKTVETLGSATVICTDKTGTITENQMSLAKIFTLKTNAIHDIKNTFNEDEKQLIEWAMWASEPTPFDPMEVSLHETYSQIITTDERPNYKLVHEYPLSGKPPMMTHVFQNTFGHQIIATKGGIEAILGRVQLSETEITHIKTAATTLASEGYRILAVAQADFEGTDYPANQHDFSFIFKGLVAFYDPPKKNITAVLQHFYTAGIKVKIITGDNVETTGAIAKQIGFVGYEKGITGDELMQLSDAELKKTVQELNLFTRMFPEAKLRIINALKSNNEIVAMTGDGVNDGPALKASHIGIAMGKKGTEIAKQAASLILIKDDLSAMVDAIAMGRKIYANLKKAIQFIISIHIPIILTVFIPLALGWVYPTIFSPIHIIFLELIMGPTCSIVYENEPMEKNAMLQKPRPFTDTFFSWKELSTSIIQGLVITLGTLFVYQYAIHLNYNEATTRTMVFTCLVTANVFLTLSNRSFYEAITTTIRYKNNLIPIIIAITVGITSLLIYIPNLARFFEFESLNGTQLSIAAGVGLLVVIWYELVKIVKRSRK